MNTELQLTDAGITDRHLCITDRDGNTVTETRDSTDRYGIQLIDTGFN